MGKATPISLAEAKAAQASGDWVDLTEADIAHDQEVLDPTDFDRGRWINVRNASSHVERFRYDAKTKRLFVTFQPDTKGFMAEGCYENVPIEYYASFKDSPSFGSYVWHQLRNRFQWTRLNYSVK